MSAGFSAMKDEIEIDLNKDLINEINKKLEIDEEYLEYVGIKNFIREKIEMNLRSIGDSAKSSLEVVEILKVVGFSAIEAKKLEKMIDEQIKHCSLKNWVSLYLDGKFKDKDLFSCSNFPFEGPENVRFTINFSSTRYLDGFNHHNKEIAIWNLGSSLSEREISNKIIEIQKTLSLGVETWFHGTTGKFVKNILTNGVNVLIGNAQKDFSHNGGFYLQQNFIKTKNWAFLIGKIYESQITAVLIYNIPEKQLSTYRGLPKLNQDNKNDWNEVTHYFRCGCFAPKPSCFPENENEIDFIIGLIGEFGKNNNELTYTQNIDETQLCIKSGRMARFINKCLVGVVFFKSI